MEPTENPEESRFLDAFESGFGPRIASFMLIDDLWQSWDRDNPSSWSLISQWFLIPSNHSILLDQLQVLGIGGTVLQSFFSFFVNSSSGCWIDCFLSHSSVGYDRDQYYFPSCLSSL